MTVPAVRSTWDNTGASVATAWISARIRHSVAVTCAVARCSRHQPDAAVIRRWLLSTASACGRGTPLGPGRHAPVRLSLATSGLLDTAAGGGNVHAMAQSPASGPDRAVESSVALTPESARSALELACEKVQLDPSNAALVRIGSNAVFRLMQRIVARVSRNVDALEQVERQIDVARWLESVNFPATRALGLDQPVLAHDCLVTFWVSASEVEEFASIAQVAEVIRRLHALQAPASLRLPAVDSFKRTAGELETAGGITTGDRDFLKARLRELAGQYSALTFVLPEGVIHGDANVGNVILDRQGEPVLIDLDDFRIGPREWDLVQTALFYERFGWHTEAEYRTFVDVYGWDIMSWQGYKVLADYREISMTVWLAGKAAARDEASTEVAKRVEAMRTGASRRDWAPF